MDEGQAAGVGVPVFVGGFRSGSTLLINYLGLHPHLSAVYETKFLVELLRIVRLYQDEGGRGEQERDFLRWRMRDPALSRAGAVEVMIRQALADIHQTQQVLEGLKPDGKAGYERYALGTNHILWTSAEALGAIEPFLDAVLADSPIEILHAALGSAIRTLFTLHADREGKRRWVNKTPEILRFQPELRQILGRVRFIHLIRDGRDVVHSSVRLNWWSAEMGAQAWRRFIEEARTHASDRPEDYLELRYEDLVSDHAGTLAKVLRFLKIDGDPKEIIAVQERMVPGSTSGQEAERRIGQWRAAMSAEDRTAFKAIANDLLVSLGYARDAAW